MGGRERMGRGGRRAFLLTAVVAAVLLVMSTFAGAPTASAAAKGGRVKPGPKTTTTTTVAPAVSSPSVMIQLSTLAQVTSPAQLASWMGRICPAGVDPTGRLVLQDIATVEGVLLTGFLDVLLPYLPGSSTQPCFSEVYVGTVDPLWTGAGNAYVEGIQDPAFRLAYQALATAAAQSFVLRYPTVTANWYLTYEANLNALYYPEVEAGYESLFGGLLRDLTALTPGRRVMWSPAFWYPHSAYSQNTTGMAGLTQQLTRLFSVLQGTGGGIHVVNLQDYVAGSSCQPLSNRMQPSDAVGWTEFLRGLGVIPDVMINVEQYAIDCTSGGITSGNPSEVQQREAYYQTAGLTLGPAFELRYWLQTHP